MKIIIQVDELGDVPKQSCLGIRDKVEGLNWSTSGDTQMYYVTDASGNITDLSSVHPGYQIM